jgi:hypothetical protein
MKNFYYCIFLSVFSVFSVFSQHNDGFTKSFTLESSTLNVREYMPGKSISNQIDGSEYLFSNWSDSYIVKTIKGDAYQISNFNYNLKTKKIESFISKDSIFQYDLKQFEYLIKGNVKYKVVCSNSVNGLFLEVFSGKKKQLFKEFNIVVQHGKFNAIMPSQSTNDKFIQSYSYYVYENEKYEKIKLSKKEILKSVSDNEDVIKGFVKKNKLKYNSIEDVVQIFRYYDSL